MHHPRCLDPESQDAAIPHPYPYDGGCRLGGPGHCRKCPHRGQDDPRWVRLQRLAAYWSHKPDTVFLGGRRMPQEAVDFLWPPRERDWIEREDKWKERASYHIAMGKSELIRELLRELHDLRRAVKPILAAYRSEPAHITEEEITKAWEAFDGPKG
jgi:hypothetical protein